TRYTYFLSRFSLTTVHEKAIHVSKFHLVRNAPQLSAYGCKKAQMNELGIVFLKNGS
ncbi:unnamed protein product, partial [Hymenolepis diminuta]